MTITTILFYAVMRDRLGRGKAMRLLVLFLCFDVSFLAANALKIKHGGWLPLAIGGALFVIMTTWHRARIALGGVMRQRAQPLQEFLAQLGTKTPLRVPGAAVFMTSSPDVAPPVMLHHLLHNKVLHERVIVLVITTENVPDVPDHRRVEVEDLGQGIYHVTARYGFIQTPHVPDIIAAVRAKGLDLVLEDTTFYLGRESLLPTGMARLMRWRKRLFMFLARNARSPTYYFGIPPDRVIEIGMQIPL
jgi:KUP system potassium uptake protein